ncbi:digestive cysteine proteinase 1 [Anthonomus grandis grandis]|uniref:digestive cysteine proteinase 1 n=1 Tax=Anthonomus grandis grandis TaxID=2921223 RepID=UPI00216622B9|nr:digestive cysteine proteinase 1 [Anthonomus grandis grandis]
MWFFGFLWAAVALLISVKCEELPVWSDVYSVKGVLFIPYAEIAEPFSAWFDNGNNLSRIDYYGDMVKTYQLAKTGYGTSIKIAPVTTEDEENARTCLQVNGTAKEPITTQGVLPDLTGYEYNGDEMIEGIQTQRWNLTTVIGEKKNKYVLWVRFMVENDKKVAVPVRFEMRGYNVILGSHYDHYYLRYDEYDVNPIDSSIFEVSQNLTCQGFPGPGDKHIYTFNPMAEFIKPEKQGHLDLEFNKFTSKHNKTYESTKETMLRKEIFRQNVRYIHSHNRKNIGYYLTVNHLADKTDNELKALRGKTYSGEYNGGKPFPLLKSSNLTNLPDQWDWRLYGAVTPVKDQSVCGSCWSFGTVGTVEGALFLKNGGHLVRLSQQALIDCSWGYGNNGCDGGEDFRAYQWMEKHGGIPTEEDYGPYLGQDGYCHADKVPKVAKLNHWVNVTTNNEDALRLAIFKNGPVSVAIDASQKTFSFYSNGVYYDESCGNTEERLDHAVLAVGYGTLNGQNYWLIKNSWSNYWGNDGYVLMASKDNNCGVMTSPTYVVLE